MKNLIISIAIILVILGFFVFDVPSMLRLSQDSRRSGCISNLRMLDAAKEQAAEQFKISEGGTVTVEQLDGFIKNGTQSLKCYDDPKHAFNTSYSIERIGSKPLCLINSSSHTL